MLFTITKLSFRHIRYVIVCLGLVIVSSCSAPEMEQDATAVLPMPDPNNGGISLPTNFGAAVVADDIGRTRHIAVDHEGDIYVMLRSSIEGKGVAALRDTSGDGRIDIVERFADSVGGTGMDIHKGYIYYSSRKHVYRAPLTEGALLPEVAIDTLITFPDSTTSGHSSKAFTFDESGNIYVNIGSRSNACQVEQRTKGSMGKDPCPELPYRAAIWKFKDDVVGQVQDDGEAYAFGIRNTVALDWNHEVNKLYAAQHGRDDLYRFWPASYTARDSREMPAEEFLLVEEGDDYGWPYCYYDQFQGKKMLAPEYGGDGTTQGRCEGIKQPIVAFPGHWGPNDLLFYTGDQFPERYKHGAFIAFHGSWNRIEFEQAGFLVAFVPMENGQPSGDWEIFAQGFVGPNPVTSPGDAVYRPTGLAQGSDGSLYVTDDQDGRIWRIMYYGEEYEEIRKGFDEQMVEAPMKIEDSVMTEEVVYVEGKKVYDMYCQACHMASGKGVPSMNPPLAGTDWVTGDKDRLIRVILNGMQDPIEINGETYQNVMAAHDFLSNEQIADVLSYIRNSFGNEASEVSPEEVAAVREEVLN